MKPTFRLSRVRAPRGTLSASLLVAIVFITFGIVASAFGLVDAAHDRHYVESSASMFTHWLFGLR